MRRRQRGQTLIIAMIVLGLLLLLGFVFLGIVDRNIKGSATSQSRSEANDLAEAGSRYALSQLVNSPLGADWRGMPTQLTGIAGNPNVTLDPDALYLRVGTGLAFRSDNPNQKDLGGPDGLGPFIRVAFNRGRALVRVRYAPSDANVFSTSPTGPLRTPGVVHNYLIIESIGRVGRVVTSDPTTLASGTGVQFQGFGSPAQLQAAIGTMKQYDSRFVNSRPIIAFATTGIIDHARFITNKFHLTRPADIGFPQGVGVQYQGLDLASQVSYVLGVSGPINAPSLNAVPGGFGDIMSNADIQFHGSNVINTNSYFGGKIQTSGVFGADAGSTLKLNVAQYNPGNRTWTTVSVPALNSNQLNSRSNTFSTVGGTLLDGLARTDAAGYPRGAGQVTPPSMEVVDPETKESRYLAITRESGIGVNGVNSGSFGHGRGVYVSNTSDRQSPLGESGRAGTGAQESLLNDWLNPNNGDANSGWRGPFYVPVGAYVQLLSDGFTIQRSDQTWKNPNGTDSGLSTIRYRIGWVNGQLYIVDSLETNVNGAAGSVNFTAGQPFNGVLYFEGNVRIRGLIPTNVQLTVVSNASIYIEGSIVKGAVGNDVTQAQGGTGYDLPITTPSKSMIMLMAKDYVTVNTTQFFGLQPGQSVQEVNDQQNNTGYNPVRLAAGGGSGSGQLNLNFDLLTDGSASATPNDPSSYKPYALNYFDCLNTSQAIPTKLLLTHTMDDGTAPASFLAMNLNYGVYGDPSQTPSVYYFPGTSSPQGYFTGLTNTASDYLGTGSNSISMYGLGGQPWQRYDKFESREFTLIQPGASSYNQGTIANTNSTAEPFISYDLFAPGTNDVLLRPSSIVGVASNDYLLARAAIVPDDIRIEASIFAEEGSFFVIPGPWFDPNPNDSRENYVARLTTLQSGGMSLAQAHAQADQERLEAYGNSPWVPFFGEPLDVRVTLVGAISENMPPPEADQSEYLRKWGWIPEAIGSDAGNIPLSHIPNGTNPSTVSVVPNLITAYDPALATGRTVGFTGTNDIGDLIRVDAFGRALPPMPRLPVSPVLTYFGEIQ